MTDEQKFNVGADGSVYADFSDIALSEVSEVETEPFKPSEELQKIVADTLEGIQSRSFSGRHPELGKMINCAVCHRRHRGQQCEQIFARRWKVEDGKKVYTDEKLIAGDTEETKSLMTPNMRLMVGAKFFAKRRRHPHPNRRNLLYIETVRGFTPDEFTQEDLKEAHKRARVVLGMNRLKSYGTMEKPEAGKSVGKLKFAAQSKRVN